MIDLDPATQQVVDNFDALAKKRAAELLGITTNELLQSIRETAFCLGYKAGVVDLGVSAKRAAVVFAAAERWRDAPCDDLPFCERGVHERECTTEKLERELVAAIDAARKEPPGSLA